MNKTFFAGLGLYLVLGMMAITFQGGYIPHWIDVGNNETVVAYTNGVVYTKSGNGIGAKRTLWQAKDGSIMSSYSVVASGVYMNIPVPATPQEIATWRKAQDILAEKKGVFRI